MTGLIEKSSVIVPGSGYEFLRLVDETAAGSLFLGYADKQTKVKTGRAVLALKEGCVFEGYYKNGKPNGPGRLVYLNGNVYEGTFVDGLHDGTGKYLWANGDVYEGSFS